MDEEHDGSISSERRGEPHHLDVGFPADVGNQWCKKPSVGTWLVYHFPAEAYADPSAEASVATFSETAKPIAPQSPAEASVAIVSKTMTSTVAQLPAEASSADMNTKWYLKPSVGTWTSF